MNYAGQSTFEIEGNKIMKAIQIVAPEKAEIVDVVPIQNPCLPGALMVSEHGYWHPLNRHRSQVGRIHGYDGAGRHSPVTTTR